jgi:hypothetical protein
MRYMIYDDEGNALGRYRSRVAAEANLRAMASADPESADDLVVMMYHDDGTLSGSAITVRDLAPAVSVAHSHPCLQVLGFSGGREVARHAGPRLNEYDPLVLAGRRPAPSLVRSKPDTPQPLHAGS